MATSQRSKWRASRPGFQAAAQRTELRSTAATIKQKDRQPVQTPTTPPTDRCLLLALPPELRNRIWEYVVVQRHSINVLTSTHASRPSRDVIPPPVSQSCRKIRAETLSMFYQCNVFEAYLLFYRARSQLSAVSFWIDNLDVGTRKRIGRVLLCTHARELSTVTAVDDVIQGINPARLRLRWGGEVKDGEEGSSGDAKASRCAANMNYDAKLRHYALLLE